MRALHSIQVKHTYREAHDDQNYPYFRFSFKDNFKEKKYSNWKLFNHWIIIFIVSARLKGEFYSP